MITSPTAPASTLARDSASWTAITPKSAALNEASAPPNLPMAVRTAEAIKTECDVKPLDTHPARQIRILGTDTELSVTVLRILAPLPHTVRGNSTYNRG